MKYNNNNSNEKEYNKKRRGEKKKKKNPVMHNAIAHHPLTDAQTAIRHPSSLYTERDVIWYGISLWLVRVSCSALLPPSFLHTCLLAEHGKLESPWLKISAT